MNRRQTDSLDTNAFAKTCALLDNAKMRESLTACENECVALKAHIKALESLLAETADKLKKEVAGKIQWDSDIDYQNLLFSRIDAILPATEIDIDGMAKLSTDAYEHYVATGEKPSRTKILPATEADNG